MNKIVASLLLFLFIALFMGCSKVALTGRRQLNIVSDQEVAAMGIKSFDEFMATAKNSDNILYSNSVTRVGRRLVAAVERYWKEQGMEADLQNYAWEFRVVVDAQVNAFCMPGGKIVFYEGIMPLCDSDDKIAVVMSHEIAHALAKHSSERMSQQMVAQIGGEVLGIALSQKSTMTQVLAQSVYGLGAQVGVMLPYSRKHEYEADRIGLILMALAGYDLEQAVEFWTIMASNGGAKPIEFMSTHPSDQSRIDKIRQEIPQAMGYAVK